MIEQELRVLFLTESAEVWGAEQSLLLLLEHAVKNGVVPTVAHGPNSPLRPLLDEAGIEAFEYKFANHPALARSGSLSGATRRELIGEASSVAIGGARIARIVRKFDVAVPFSLWQSPEAIIGSSLARTTCVLDLHETFGGSMGRRLVRIMTQLTSGSIAPSKHLVNQYGMSKSSVIPRPVPVKVPVSVSRARESSVRKIGMFGQISPHKNVLEVVKRFGQRKDAPNWSLLIVGGRPVEQRSPYELEVREAVEALCNASRVIERVEDVTPLMRECDFVINASTHEAFGRTVLECVFEGAVPLVMDGSGPAEIVQDTGVGRIFSSIDSLVQFAAEEAPAPMSLTAIEDASDRYSPDAVAKIYFSAIRRFHGGNNA